MATRNTSSSSTILLVILLFLTFPIWIGLGGLVIGLTFGLIGGVFGLIGGIIGAVFGTIAWVFKSIFHIFFGWHTDVDWPFHSHHHFSGYTFLAIIIVVALVVNHRGKK